MTYIALSILLGFFGVTLLSLGSHRLMRARYWAAGGNIVGGFLLLAVGGLLYVISLNLQTYTSLSTDAPIAELSFNKLGSGSYRATLMRLPAGELQVFTLNGDEWQMDARILEWHAWTHALGLTRQFRLEHIGGREQTAGANRYRLSNNPGFDLWNWIVSHPQETSLVDATAIDSSPLPMTDGARYRISVNPTGLVAQPIGVPSK